MTTEFTNTIIFAPSGNMANSYSSSAPASADADAFSSLLDNASKAYADKTENTRVTDTSKNNELAQKTKDIDSSKKSEVKEQPEESVKENSNDPQDKVSPEKSDKAEKNEKTDKTENNKEIDKKDDSSDTKNTEAVQDSAQDKAEPVQNKECDNSQIPQQVGQNKVLESPTATVIIGNVAAETGNIANSVDIANDSENTDVLMPAVQKNEKQNVIANEQLLANIEYSDTADIEAALKTQIPDIDEKTLKAIVEEAKKAVSAATDTQEPVNVQLKPNTQQTEISDLSKNTFDSLQNTAKTDTQPEFKTAADNLKSDMSRLTAVIDIEEPLQESQIQTEKPITPADTELDKAPVIKVAQEAVASTNIKETSTAGLENKDTVSKIKDRAVSQMTALQDTDTVVTQSTMADSAESQQGSLSQNNTNAQEQVVKLSVDDSSVSMNSTGAADTFASRLESQISARAASSNTQTLNQNDIMSQVNAKFEQLQQSGNNKVSIVLQPENLGRVSVEIMSTKEGVVAKMLTDNQQVKDIFDKNIDALKNNLSSQGVNVNSIKVECTQESSNNAMNFERDQFNQAFNNQQNSSQHGQTNQSETSAQNAYAQDSGEFEESEADTVNSAEIKNTDTIIKHNGKVDYTV